MITRIALPLLLFLPGACASTPEARPPPETASAPLRGGIAALDVISYDGKTLEARVLLGATLDPLVIDGRLIAPGDVNLEDLRACDDERPLKPIVDCIVAPPPTPEQQMTLRPGYWYGRKVSFGLFDATAAGLGPACFQAALVLRTLDERVAARLPIRVVRTAPPP